MDVLNLLLLVLNQYVLTVPGVLGVVAVVGGFALVAHTYGKELLDIVFAIAEALKPEPDGSIKIERAEIDRIKKEIGDLKNLGFFAKLFGKKRG